MLGDSIGTGVIIVKRLVDALAVLECYKIILFQHYICTFELLIRVEFIILSDFRVPPQRSPELPWKVRLLCPFFTLASSKFPNMLHWMTPAAVSSNEQSVLFSFFWSSFSLNVTMDFTMDRQ